MSRSTRKPTVWTWISLGMTRRLTRTDMFRPKRMFCFYYTSIPLRRNVSARISMCGLRGLIRIDTHYAESIMLTFSWNVSYI